MSKSLVLAEKPSVGRDIARVLDCKQKGQGCLIGSKYIVTWALGHLVTLAEPERYEKRYKTWKLEDLPMLPQKMDLVVIRQTSKQFENIKKLLHRKDINQIIIATDAGREGELVARWIIQRSGSSKPIKRLWISSQTDRAIRDGFANLSNGREYDNLYMSAQCRAEADWLVGLNVTRALTCRHNAQLSAGRVQTPTLAMIVNREKEIRSFVPKDYWTLQVKVNDFTLQWKDNKSGQDRIFNKAHADDIVSKLGGQSLQITEIKKNKKQLPSPLAYDLTELQRDANREFGYSAKQTLSILQRLYETHKLVTYPRTDSRYISSDIVPTLPERLRSIAVGPYAKPAEHILKQKIHTSKRFVDNSKVTDHHALLPTEEPVNLSSLSFEERNIYDLIIKRFLAVLYPPFKYEETVVTAQAKGENFYAYGIIIQSMGWKEVYQNHNHWQEEDNEDEEYNNQSLPPVHQGDILKIVSINSIPGKTRPPKRYTEATLLTAMEHPEHLVDNKSLRKALSDSSGLGTPATRADIIEKLFDSFYVEKKGQEIIPTSKGIQLVELAPDDLRSPELTAKWEQQLTEISRGKRDSKEFIRNIHQYTSRLVSKVISSDATYRHDNMVRVQCPECGKYLLEVKNKKGRMYVCQDRECGYRRPIALFSNARCPECHKKMEIRGEGENKLFFCSCGYREKLSSFQKRKEEQKNKADRRDVRRYMNKQEVDQPINTALADALAKLKSK